MIHQYENYLQSRHAPDNCYLCRWVHSLWGWGGLEKICALAAACRDGQGSHQLRALLNAPAMAPAHGIARAAAVERNGTNRHICHPQNHCAVQGAGC